MARAVRAHTRHSFEQKVFYRQVLDLYATSVDYDPRTPESAEFFKIVQNKMHFAAHGHTAAEVIAKRVNAELPFMGLTVFSGMHPQKSEIAIAKNYLTEDELAVLNRMVSALDSTGQSFCCQCLACYAPSGFYQGRRVVISCRQFDSLCNCGADTLNSVVSLNWLNPIALRKEDEVIMHEQNGTIILYSTDSGNIAINVRFENETFWLTQKAIAELFDTERSVITKHLANIYAEEELEKESTCAKIAQVQTEGNRQVTRSVEFYNLDAIIAVGYRVNSKKATKFRQWATKTLREYIQKGFVLNEDMLKNGKPFGRDYFDELLEKIREIRASERRAYQKIADIFEQCSYDYDKNSELTRQFYAFVQNKLHFAVTGKTAAELISERVSTNHPTMGLTTWKGAPEGKILKRDIAVAKNYLNKQELSRLNRLVSMFIDYAELMADDGVAMSMRDWLGEKITAEKYCREKEQCLTMTQ